MCVEIYDVKSGILDIEMSPYADVYTSEPSGVVKVHIRVVIDHKLFNLIWLIQRIIKLTLWVSLEDLDVKIVT